MKGTAVKGRVSSWWAPTRFVACSLGDMEDFSYIMEIAAEGGLRMCNFVNQVLFSVSQRSVWSSVGIFSIRFPEQLRNVRAGMKNNQTGKEVRLLNAILK
jgi:hypothetical protein